MAIKMKETSRTDMSYKNVSPTKETYAILDVIKGIIARCKIVSSKDN